MDSLVDASSHLCHVMGLPSREWSERGAKRGTEDHNVLNIPGSPGNSCRAVAQSTVVRSSQSACPCEANVICAVDLQFTARLKVRSEVAARRNEKGKNLPAESERRYMETLTFCIQVMLYVVCPQTPTLKSRKQPKGSSKWKEKKLDLRLL